MRLAVFERAADPAGSQPRLGVVHGDRMLDASDALTAVPDVDLARRGLCEVIAAWGQVQGTLQALAQAGDDAAGVPLSDVRLRAPLRPTTIMCCIGNYKEGQVRDPVPLDMFLKSPTAVIGPGETVELPPAQCSIFHHEVELAVVIGRPAFRVSAAEAMEYVCGYAVFIDVSGRQFPVGRDSRSFIGKSFATFAPIGPWVATADEIPDPQSLAVRLWVGDDLRQDYNTDDMEHPVPALVAWASDVLPLQPGDVIACGTNHQGLGPLQDGDTATVEIERIGRFTVSVRDPLGRSWPR